LGTHAESQAEFQLVPNRPEVLTEVNIEKAIQPNNFGGFGIEYTGGASSLIKEIKVEWE